MEGDHKKKKLNLFTYMTVFTVGTLSFSFGLIVTWPSPVILKLETEGNPLGYRISTEEASWITSLFNLGSMCGPIPFGYISNKLGRKITLIGMGILALISFLILTFAHTMTLYYTARFIAGISGGGIVSISAVYISEVAHQQDRSSLNAISTAMLSFGSLVTYLVGPYLSVTAFNNFCAIFPALFCVIFTVFMYETPPFLLSVCKHDEAHKVLRKLRATPQEIIERELQEMQDYVSAHKDENSLAHVIKSLVFMKCFGIALLLITAQHLCGVFTLTAYTQEIFENANNPLPSDISAIIVASVQFVFSFGAPYIVRKFRFRVLLPCSSGGMAISMVLMGICFYVEERTDATSMSWLLIFSMVTLVLSYTYGIGVVPGIMMVEMFPTGVRSVAITVSYTIGSLQSFLVNRYFLPASEVVGMAACLWVFAAVNAISTAIFVAIIPETNGKSFEEIQVMLRHK